MALQCSLTRRYWRNFHTQRKLDLQIGQVDPIDNGVHRFGNAWIGVDVGGLSGLSIPKVINGQTPMPIQILPYFLKMLPDDRAIHSYLYDGAAPGTFQQAAGAVQGEQMPMVKNGMRLFKIPGCGGLNEKFGLPVQ